MKASREPGLAVLGDEEPACYGTVVLGDRVVGAMFVKASVEGKDVAVVVGEGANVLQTGVVEDGAVGARLLEQALTEPVWRGLVLRDGACHEQVW